MCKNIDIGARNALWDFPTQGSVKKIIDREKKTSAAKHIVHRVGIPLSFRVFSQLRVFSVPVHYTHPPCHQLLALDSVAK